VRWWDLEVVKEASVRSHPTTIIGYPQSNENGSNAISFPLCEKGIALYKAHSIYSTKIIPGLYMTCMEETLPELSPRYQNPLTLVENWKE
jgi:hypothetical protein